MKFIWKDYKQPVMSFVEEWLDAEAIKATGLDDGWQDFYEYWLNEEYNILGKNYWCKVVFEETVPFAVIALGFFENRLIIMELVINPEMRSKGKGTALMKELLNNGKEIIGTQIANAEAVIYPSNIASKKAFEKAGFVFDGAHEDGDALYYRYSAT